MCTIYYPFFKIEMSNYKKKYDHKKNLFTLALVCNKILIPAKHLLEMKNDRMDILVNNQTLFQKDIVFSRVPEDVKDLSKYYEGIKADIKDKTSEIVDRRIERIINKLYEGKECEQYNPLDQQDYYSTKMQEFVKEYAKRHKNVKGLELINDMWANKFIIKETFDVKLTKLKDKNLITKETYRRLKKASDLIYFLAGVSAENMKVCYDDFFNHQCIQNEIRVVIPDLDEKISEKYSPEYIIRLLKNIGVIQSEDDIGKLKIDDILYLRNQACFKEFIKKYDEYSSRPEFERIIEKKKNNFAIICGIKAIMVSIALTVMGAFLSTKFMPNIWTSIIFSIMTLVITYIITYLWQTKYSYKIILLESILDKIIGYIDPIALYFAKLKWKISSKD